MQLLLTCVFCSSSASDVQSVASTVRNEGTMPHVTLPCRTTAWQPEVVKSISITNSYSTYADSQSLSTVSRSVSLPVGDLLLGQHHSEQSTDR